MYAVAKGIFHTNYSEERGLSFISNSGQSAIFKSEKRRFSKTVQRTNFPTRLPLSCRSLAPSCFTIKGPERRTMQHDSGVEEELHVRGSIRWSNSSFSPPRSSESTVNFGHFAQNPPCGCITLTTPAQCQRCCAVVCHESAELDLEAYTLETLPR